MCGDLSGLFFADTQIERLIALNSAFMTPKLAQEVLRRIRLAHPCTLSHEPEPDLAIEFAVASRAREGFAEFEDMLTRAGRGREIHRSSSQLFPVYPSSNKKAP